MKIKAVVVSELGGPSVLQLRDDVQLAWPAGDRDVLVRLKAAALNPADVFFRELGGYLDNGDGAPFVLGHDGSGIVEAVGAGVSNFKPGDRVALCSGGIGPGGRMGTYAEAAVVPEYALAKIPDAITDFKVSSSVPLVAITAWESLIDRARVSSGEHVLIHAGAGGTGQMAIQLAKLQGAKVATTVSTPEKGEAVRKLGADKVIFYKEQDFVAETLAWTDGKGVQVALDNAGPEIMVKTYKAMEPYGRVVTLMGTPADDGETTAYNMNLTLHNVMMLTPMWKGLEDKIAAQAQIVDKVLKLVAEGKVKVDVSASFPLAEASKAQEALSSGKHTGKIVLEM